MRILPGLRAATAAALALLALGGQATSDPLPENQPAAASPSLFERAFDRREYLRESRPLRRRAEAAERDAERARAAAAEARRSVEEPPLIASPPTLQADAAFEKRRLAEREAHAARLKAQQERLQRFLQAGRRADAAALRSEIEAAGSARTGQIVRGLDRLYAGAASERNRLGDRSLQERSPLIRAPRVHTE